jgi:hypothetical protein
VGRVVPAASKHAHVAQSVEHVLGKDEVTGSIPVVGSRFEGGVGGCDEEVAESQAWRKKAHGTVPYPLSAFGLL